MKLTTVHKKIILLPCLLFSLFTHHAMAVSHSTMTQDELDKGNTLINQKQFFQATRYFTKLEQKYPNDAIVKNNLAVLKARSGKLEDAINLLKKAIDANQISQANYANLVTIFDYQTSVAYREILSNNKKSTHVPTLNIINKIAKKPKPKIIIKEVIKEIPAEPKVIIKEVIKEVPAEPKIIIKEVIKEVIKTVYIPKEVKVTTDKKALNDEKGDMHESILNALSQWKTAWEKQNTKLYINSYIDFYKSDKFNTHKAWRAHRINRITRPNFIKIELSNIQVLILSKYSAKVQFIQHYQSDNYKDQTEKELIFNKIDDEWKITSEKSMQNAR